MSENDMRLPPKLLSRHLRCRAKVMRECGSRLAPDFEDAADCIDNLRHSNAPRVEYEEMRYMVEQAITSIRAAKTTGAQLVRAMNHLQCLRTYLDDKLSPVYDDE